MQLVLIGPTYPFRGGIAHHTTLLATHLARRHEVRLLTFLAQYPQPLFPGRTDRDPSRHVVSGMAEPILAPLRPWTWLRTSRRVAAVNPDLTLVQWWVPYWSPSIAAVSRLVRRWTNSRVVFVCHNVLPHEGVSPVTRALVRLALGQGDEFIVHSEKDFRALVRLLPDRTRDGKAVHRAVLPAHTIAHPATRNEARRRLDIPGSAPLALFFGFVRPYKGLGYLIDSLPLALEKVPELRLLIAGEFWEPVERYQRRIDELGLRERVIVDDRYIPNEEVGNYFAAADVVVLPYTDATQSGVVTLASEFGCPIIATSVGGLPEVVIDNRTGLIVPPADSSALAESLIELLTNRSLRERLRHGVAEERDRFSWSRLVELVESLAAPTGSSP